MGVIGSTGSLGATGVTGATGAALVRIQSVKRRVARNAGCPGRDYDMTRN